jgi:hypothetical protein
VPVAVPLDVKLSWFKLAAESTVETSYCKIPSATPPEVAAKPPAIWNPKPVPKALSSGEIANAEAGSDSAVPLEVEV